MSEIELAPNNQFAAVVKPGEVFEVASDCYTRIERFSILSDYTPFAGQRVSVMASVDAPTVDGRTVNMNVAVASFIVGRDFDQNCELVISPADKCKLSVVGAPVEMQMLFSKFPGE